MVIFIEMEEEKMSNKPAQSWNMGGVQIAMWVNDKGASFTLQKRYKDQASGEWKESKYLYASDLAALAALIPSAVGASLNVKRGQSAQVGVSEPVAQDVPSAIDDDDIPF